MDDILPLEKIVCCLLGWWVDTTSHYVDIMHLVPTPLFCSALMVPPMGALYCTVVTQIQLIALTKTFVPNMCLSHYHSSSLISRCPRTVAAPPKVLNEIFINFEYQP